MAPVMPTRLPSTLCCLCLSIAAAVPAGCEVGFQSIGGDDSTASDADTSGGPGSDGDDDEDSSGDGDPSGGDEAICPLPAGAVEAELAFEVDVDGKSIGPEPFDAACSVSAYAAGDTTALTLACGPAEVELTVAATPPLALPVGLGDPVVLRLEITDEALPSTYVRLDFPATDSIVTLVHALAPMLTYLPLPLADAPELDIDHGCDASDCPSVRLLPWSLELVGELELVSVRSGEFVEVDAADGSARFWNRQSASMQITSTCGAADDRTFLFMVQATGLGPVASEPCNPNTAEPCGPGLICCNPCAGVECEPVCRIGDAACPPPAP